MIASVIRKASRWGFTSCTRKMRAPRSRQSSSAPRQARNGRPFRCRSSAPEERFARHADEKRRADRRKLRHSGKQGAVVLEPLAEANPGIEDRASRRPCRSLRVAAIRCRRKLATSATTSSYCGECCIVRGVPCMHEHRAGPVARRRPRPWRIAEERGDVVHDIRPGFHAPHRDTAAFDVSMEISTWLRSRIARMTGTTRRSSSSSPLPPPRRAGSIPRRCR